MSSMILSSKGAALEAREKREKEHGRGKVFGESSWVNMERKTSMRYCTVEKQVIKSKYLIFSGWL